MFNNSKVGNKYKWIYMKTKFKKEYYDEKNYKFNKYNEFPLN